MVFYRCGLCERRLESNRATARCGATCRWNKVLQYAEVENIVVSPHDVICGKCDTKLRRPLLKRLALNTFDASTCLVSKKSRTHNSVELEDVNQNGASDNENQLTYEESLPGPSGLGFAEINSQPDDLQLSPESGLDNNSQSDHLLSPEKWSPGFSDTSTIHSITSSQASNTSDTENESQESVSDDGAVLGQSSVADCTASSSISSQPCSNVGSDCGFSDSSFNSTGMWVKMKSLKPTQNKCCICGNTGKGSRLRISKVASLDLLQKTGILAPKQNRACGSHFEDGTFSATTIREIQSTANEIFLTPEETSSLIHDLLDLSKQTRQIMDFGPNSPFSENDFITLVGYSKEQFAIIFKSISAHLNDSCNRSACNALAVFLVKLRLNLPQNVLAILFGFHSQQAVSDTIDRVSLLLDAHFVPDHLGYEATHSTREDFIQNHQGNFASQLCGVTLATLILILDGTYLYTQKLKDHHGQRVTYSGQKHRNLVKPMMCVAPDGYILSSEGPYQANNNDASILNSMLENSGEGSLKNFLNNDSLFILDRGFRDSKRTLTNNHIKYKMPKFLKNTQKQFTTREGNESRVVTFLRWVVEVANGRIKNRFKFFEDVIPASYYPKIGRFFRICCALINAFQPPIFKETPNHAELASKILSRVKSTNELQKLINKEKLDKKRACWITKQEASEVAFPTLTISDLKEITLGVYQISQSEHYSRGHINNTHYHIDLHKEKDNLIRAQIQSRFSNSQTHNCWIQFDIENEGAESITGWFCQCRAGARTVGCCAHITSVLWFLGYARHQEKPLPTRRSLSDNILDASAVCGPEDGAGVGNRQETGEDTPQEREQSRAEVVPSASTSQARPNDPENGSNAALPGGGVSNDNGNTSDEEDDIQPGPSYNNLDSSLDQTYEEFDLLEDNNDCENN